MSCSFLKTMAAPSKQSVVFQFLLNKWCVVHLRLHLPAFKTSSYHPICKASNVIYGPSNVSICAQWMKRGFYTPLMCFQLHITELSAEWLTKGEGATANWKRMKHKTNVKDKKLKHEKNKQWLRWTVFNTYFLFRSLHVITLLFSADGWWTNKQE